MNAFLKQQVNELRQRIGADMQARATLEGTRATPAGAAAVADQIRRLDADIAEAARDLAVAERKLKDGL
jgi:hypothetical protein